jgi:hypothetical protein
MDSPRTLLAALVLLTVSAAVSPVRADDTPASPPGMIDLSQAVIVEGESLNPHKGAEPLLQSQLLTRARLSWGVAHDWSVTGGRPVVAIGTRAGGLAWAGPFKERLGDGKFVEGPEGYRIETDPKVPGVIVVGNDARGAMFGAGRLLRELRLRPGQAFLPNDFRASSAPKVRLRGHQLGYRPKTNSYDGWDRPQWFRYISELAVFGTNAIELVPPRTDDAASSPHFPRPPLEMMTEMSRVCDMLEQDVWVWFPVMDPVETDPSKVAPLLEEWGGVFRALPRLDAVFVPGGDPGHLRPSAHFNFLEQAAKVLRSAHPKAALWVSPQGFNREWYEEFLSLVKQQPEWLSGVVHGPQVRVTLEQVRRDLPARYPIRTYPDITHSRQCQHPVPDWDLAYAVTEGRESINPRPMAQAQILRSSLSTTVGFLTYSEGCNDDVNKFVWSALGWDPEADVVDVLRQYGRYFIGDREADPFAQALLGLERNWSGPLLTNAGVETTLSQLRELERSAPPRVRQNWRFQQALYRAYYDAYLRERLLAETALEARAVEALRRANELGSDLAMSRASGVLERSLTEPPSPDRRGRVFSLAEALFQSVHMQLSVEKYGAIAAERGGNLDTIDVPLNNRLWLNAQFQRIRALPTERERLRALDALVNRTDPGPGGFYDDLGDPSRQPHLVVGDGFAADPALFRTAFVGFALRPDWPASWRTYAQSFYDGPLRMRYQGLDPAARYRVRITYAGDSPRTRMRLEAEGVEVHPLMPKPNPVAPVEFPVPASALADGRLELTWTAEPGRGGNGRGCQVAEVWLTRDPN